ncbi:MAG: hypothetical protein AAFV25_02780 [Bacteroidota bacterium]
MKSISNRSQPSTEEKHKDWHASYKEPYSGLLFRQDRLGNWYDIEGQRLETPVFLLGDVLCSLNGRVSRQSFSFRGEELVASPHFSLVQLGKLVLDQNLQPVKHLGEKVTGLGRKNICFSDGICIQEVHLGFDKTAFVFEDTGDPFLIGKQAVRKHLGTTQKAGHTYYSFQTLEEAFVLKDRSDRLLCCEGEAVSVDFGTYFRMGDEELALCNSPGRSYYIDLQSETPFLLDGICDGHILHIDQQALTCQGDRLRNVRTATQSLVYNESKAERFALNDGDFWPESILPAPVYPAYFAMAIRGTTTRLFQQSTQRIVQLPPAQIEISEMNGEEGQLLVNAKSAEGNSLVIDLRLGYDQPRQAQSESRPLITVHGSPAELGNTLVQNASIKTLGGSERRVIDLNHPELKVFGLPSDLRAYPEGNTPSSYCDNPIRDMDFSQGLQIEDELFFRATFIPYHDTPTPILIQQFNGRPLHLEGSGHKHELVTELKEETLENTYRIGPHRMIGAKTLTEDGRESEILFSLAERKSWLHFEDAHLPILRRVVVVQEPTKWEYLLFELHGVSPIPEYIAVERERPHRILTERARGKEVPKIIRRKIHDLSTPKELGLIQRILRGDPGYLKDIY